jgi:hypothetical protein
MNEFDEEGPLISGRNKALSDATNFDGYFSVATGGFDSYDWRRVVAYNADMLWGAGGDR